MNVKSPVADGALVVTDTLGDAVLPRFWLGRVDADIMVAGAAVAVADTDEDGDPFDATSTCPAGPK